MANLVESILERNAIETRPGPRDTIIKICCPFCGNQKFKCYIYTDQLAFHCFRCWEGNTVWRLFQHMGIEYKKGSEPVQTKFLKPPADLPQKRMVELPEMTMRFDQSHSMMRDMALDYLVDRRGLSWDEIVAYDIQFCSSGKYAGNLIFPIRNRARETVSWQAKRYMLAGQKNDNPQEGPGKSELLYGIDMAPKDGVLVIVEGPLDAIALNRMLLENGFGAIAILGHTISKLQALTIRNILNPLWVYLMFDADVSAEETKRSAEELRFAGIDDIRICSLEKGDPDDLTPSGLQQQLCNAAPYTGV